MRSAWRLAILIALLLFLFLADVPGGSRFWSAFFDAGHTALFGVVGLVFRGWLAARDPARGALRTSLIAFAITVAVGAATELGQMFQGQAGDPSLGDLLRDTAGAAAFLLVRAVVLRGVPRRAKLLFALAAAILLLAAGWTLMLTSARYLARNRAFPTLYALDGSWWEADFIELKGSRLTPGLAPLPGVGGARLARLDLDPGLYPGMTFHEPFPDWTSRRQLTLTITSDLDAPLPMAIRIDDAMHDNRTRDRYNRGLVVQPGVNQVVVPLEDVRRAPDRREMDMRRIRRIILFTYNLKRPTHVFLGAVRLE